MVLVKELKKLVDADMFGWETVTEEGEQVILTKMVYKVKLKNEGMHKKLKMHPIVGGDLQ